MQSHRKVLCQKEKQIKKLKDTWDNFWKILSSKNLFVEPENLILNQKNSEVDWKMFKTTKTNIYPVLGCAFYHIAH